MPDRTNIPDKLPIKGKNLTGSLKITYTIRNYGDDDDDDDEEEGTTTISEPELEITLGSDYSRNITHGSQEYRASAEINRRNEIEAMTVSKYYGGHENSKAVQEIREAITKAWEEFYKENPNFQKIALVNALKKKLKEQQEEVKNKQNEYERAIQKQQKLKSTLERVEFFS